jgi:hypothetical protein
MAQQLKSHVFCAIRANILQAGKVFESNVAIVEGWGQFKNRDEEKHPPLEAVTRRMVKTVTEDISVRVAMKYKVQSREVSKSPINPITNPKHRVYSRYHVTMLLSSRECQRNLRS